MAHAVCGDAAWPWRRKEARPKNAQIHNVYDAISVKIRVRDICNELGAKQTKIDNVRHTDLIQIRIAQVTEAIVIRIALDRIGGDGVTVRV